jgi:hypothetical protein
MAAIASISNGEAMSSVRTKLNSVITEINILDPIDWTDYSATSTIVGWSSFTTKVLKYRVVGKQVFIIYDFDGTSNSATTTFTLPYSAVNSTTATNYGVDNGAGNITTAILSGSTVTLYRWTSLTVIVASFTTSGSKRIFGQFNFQIA